VAQGPSLRVKIIAGVASVTVVAAGVIGYKLTHKGPPSFRRGGQFAVAGAPSSTSSTEAPTVTSGATATTAVADPAATAPATSSTTVTTVAAHAQTGAATASSGPRATTPTTRAASGPVPTTAPKSTAPAPAPSQPGTLGKPAAGTYTWNVDGTEGASFVGTRKFPDKMTMVVHTAPGLKPDQLVFDLTYSDKHAEREIVGFRSDGVYLDFEGGSVTFGPRTETSQADYDPSILEIPWPLKAGDSHSGVSKAKNADGSVSRTENWTTTVVDQEPVTIGGTTVNAWKVQIDRKFTGSDQGTRGRTMWFDPARNMWVKFVDVLHAERHQVGFSFTYDSNVTAVLAGFAP
jgi:hypothetical protein